jgi:hypothetical protein
LVERSVDDEARITMTAQRSNSTVQQEKEVDKLFDIPSITPVKVVEKRRVTEDSLK